MIENLSFKHKFFKPVDAFSTECFLRFFGVIVLLQVYSYVKFDFIQSGILTPKFLFQFDFFEFVKPLPESTMKMMLLLIFASGVLLIINRFRKVALGVFIFCFSYFFLLEKSYYNNHFYLFILIAFIFLFYNPVNDNATGKKVIPYWFLLLLQTQIVIVYFYGGIAKLNYDWVFEQQPLRILLEGSKKNALLPDLNGSAFALYLLTYGGLFYDLVVGFMLWFKQTRKVAIIVSVLFHLSNFFLFNFGESGDIGGFPFFMIGSLLLFVEPEFIRTKLSGIIPSLKKAVDHKKQKQQPKTEINFSKNEKAVLTCVSLYLAFQLLFPLRHLLYDGNTSWTAKASKWAWRMKIHNKEPDIKFYIKIPPSDTLQRVYDNQLINNMQSYYIAEDPVMILQFANFIEREVKKSGYNDVEVFVSAKVSLNGKPFYPVVDSTVNLLSLKHNKFATDKWIIPLPE